MSIFFFFIPYMIILLGIFFCLINFRKLNFEKINLIWDLSLVANSHPVLGFIFAFLICSLSGIPPLAGF